MKNLKLLAASIAVLTLAACGTNKKADIANLAGEWDVIAIGGKTMPVADKMPYIGINAGEGRIYGFAGCNRLVGSLDTTAAPGVISFDKVGATRMLCADMTTENGMLDMLKKTKGAKFDGKETVALTDASGAIVGRLQKRIGKMKHSDLQGEWKIVSADGFPSKGQTEEQPVIWFDTEEHLTHGSSGCNTFYGSYTTGDGQKLSFSSDMAASLKLCPNMEFEQKLLAAIGETKSYGMMYGGRVGLFDESGQLLIILER